MTNKPVSVDDLIDEAQGDTGCFCCGTANAEDCAAEAKRHLAEAIEHIIGTPGKGHIPDEQCCDGCDLMAEQLKRLAEWLGERQ